MKKTAGLLIGFGGPRGPEEVRPFLDSVLEGIKIPPQRYEEVLHHYDVFGGVSPYDQITERQKNALAAWLRSQQTPLSVSVAYRHSTPSFRDAFDVLKRHGIERVIGFILASFRCYSSYEKYQNKVSEAITASSATDIELVYTEPFDDDPLYWQAQADRVLEVAYKGSLVIFTAHSVPVDMCEKSVSSSDPLCYAAQFTRACEGIASLLSLPRRQWTMAYQSRSGNPRDPWLEPDIREVIDKVDLSSHKSIVVVPVGFLCDNVEVLFDLDTEARQRSLARGLEYRRAGTVGDHPRFIEMMGRRFQEKL